MRCAPASSASAAAAASWPSARRPRSAASCACSGAALLPRASRPGAAGGAPAGLLGSGASGKAAPGARPTLPADGCGPSAGRLNRTSSGARAGPPDTLLGCGDAPCSLRALHGAARPRGPCGTAARSAARPAGIGSGPGRGARRAAAQAPAPAASAPRLAGRGAPAGAGACAGCGRRAPLPLGRGGAGTPQLALVCSARAGSGRAPPAAGASGAASQQAPVRAHAQLLAAGARSHAPPGSARAPLPALHPSGEPSAASPAHSAAQPWCDGAVAGTGASTPRPPAHATQVGLLCHTGASGSRWQACCACPAQAAGMAAAAAPSIP